MELIPTREKEQDKRADVYLVSLANLDGKNGKWNPQANV
jgi:hypothetical protein